MFWTKGRRLATMTCVLILAGATSFALQDGTTTPDAKPNLKTLRAIQEERVSMVEAFTPSIVAVSQNKPDIADQTQMGRAQADSGFVVDGNYVVSCLENWPNNQGKYISTGEKMWLMAHDGTEFSGKIVGRDKRNLVVLIKMDAGHPELPSLKLGNSDNALMGSTAMGLGNTLDSMLVDNQVNFSYGVISGIYRFEPIDVMDPDDDNKGGDPYKGNVLETDVAIHDGDHGGPLINLNGEVIGMMCGHYMAGRHLGCAVPSNQIRAVIEQLKKGTKEDDLAQGYLGFKAQKPATKAGETPRIFIKEVVEESPAEAAGIKAGWELLRVDNYEIPKWNRLRERLGIGYITRKVKVGGMFGSRTVDMPVSYGVPPGTHIQLTFKDKDGKERTVDLVVGAKEEDF
ncbi:MAG: S1C family serine protease [Planctomycetota bacterium]|jgi:S1-C subfamily serine protease